MDAVHLRNWTIFRATLSGAVQCRAPGPVTDEIAGITCLACVHWLLVWTVERARLVERLANAGPDLTHLREAAVACIAGDKVATYAALVHYKQAHGWHLVAPAVPFDVIVEMTRREDDL